MLSLFFINCKLIFIDLLPSSIGLIMKCLIEQIILLRFFFIVYVLFLLHSIRKKKKKNNAHKRWSAIKFFVRLGHAGAIIKWVKKKTLEWSVWANQVYWTSLNWWRNYHKLQFRMCTSQFLHIQNKKKKKKTKNTQCELKRWERRKKSIVNILNILTHCTPLVFLHVWNLRARAHTQILHWNFVFVQFFFLLLKMKKG